MYLKIFCNTHTHTHTHTHIYILGAVGKMYELHENKK